VTTTNCPSCKRELAKDMMFCPYCGSKIHLDSVAAEASSQELVEGVIPLAIAKEGDDGQMLTLIVTKKRMLMARVTTEDTEKIRKATNSVFLGGSVLDPERHRKSLGAYARRYQSMSPETILAESPDNSSVKISEVTGIRISSEEDEKGDQFYLLSFETAAGQTKLLIPNDKDSRTLLISTFGQKVHW
jgi:hypothetical protein